MASREYHCSKCANIYYDEDLDNPIGDDCSCPMCGCGDITVEEYDPTAYDVEAADDDMIVIGKGFGETELSGTFIKTYKQRSMAGKIIKDISLAEEPHALAESLGFPVTTVKSFLRKLRDNEVLKTRVIEVDGKEYVAVDPETNAYLLEKAKNWAAFVKEYKTKK